MVVTVANQKGGTGKTSVCVNVAVELQQMGLRVLCIDLDPQASLSVWMQADAGDALRDSFANRTSLPIVTSPLGVDVVPSSRKLVEAEEIVSARPVAREFVLSQSLAPIKGLYDLILIDTPPTLSSLTLNALVCADSVLIVTDAAALSLEPVAYLLALCQDVATGYGRNLSVLGIVANRVDSRTRISRAVLSHLSEAYGGLLLGTVRGSVKMQEAPGAGHPLQSYDPTGGITEDIRELSKEIADRLGLQTRIEQTRIEQTEFFT